MLKKLKCLWTVKELREKLLFTVMILLMFCAGSRLPAPFVAPGALGVLFSGADVLSYLNMMSGSSLAQCTVFSLGVAPAINASSSCSSCASLSQNGKGMQRTMTGKSG